MTREELVKIAREHVGGVHRPVDECSDPEAHICPLAVTNPAAYDVPEWVLEAMQHAYERGTADGRNASQSLYPEGG